MTRKRTPIEGFTIIELTVVLVIIGILVSLAIPGFLRTKERAFDKEARIGLNIIKAGEKFYRVKENTYFPSGGGQANQTAMNNALQLDLVSQSWEYGINSASNTAFIARAARSVASGNSWERTWYIKESDGDPWCVGSSAACPP